MREKEAREATALAPPRVGLLDACDDPQLFGVPLMPDQRVRLDAVERTRLNVWAVGRRGLKTTSAAYVGLWSCLLRPELLVRLRPGERGFAVGIATSLRQARLIVSVARAVVERSPLLAGLIESVTEDEILFANGTGFAAFPCTSRGGRGWPIHTLLLDELAHFVDGEGPNVAAETVYRSLAPATAQFGADARVIASSTPWGATGLFAELFAKAESGELEDAYAHHATTAQANPSIDASFLEAEERRDPESFRSEYRAEFVGSGGSFFDPENTAAIVTLPGELRPEDAVRWVAGLDPAFASDPLPGCSSAAPRRIGGCSSASCAPASSAAQGGEPGRGAQGRGRDARRGRLGRSPVRRDGRARSVPGGGDRRSLAPLWHRRSLDPDDRPDEGRRLRLPARAGDEGGIELYEHPDLVRELRAVRTRYAAGRSSVVLPRIGGSHCDLAQALAIAVFEHDRHGSGESTAGVHWDPYPLGGSFGTFDVPGYGDQL